MAAPRDHITRTAAILLIITALPGCGTPAPATVAAPPSNTIDDNLERRVDALIADLRARETADRERRTHSVDRGTATIRETISSDEEKADDRETAVATRTAPAGAVVIKSSLDEMRERAASIFEARVADLQRQSAALQ